MKPTAQDTFERLKRIPLDLTEVDYTTIEMGDVNRHDYPDFCDAYIADAAFLNGRMLNDDELDQLNEQSDIVYEAACESTYG